MIDPKWEIDEYLALAAENGFEIRHVLETHNHADHVSGRGRLAEATGAAIHVPNARRGRLRRRAVDDGSSVELGDVRIVALATPGHRPEHTAYARRGPEPRRRAVDGADRRLAVRRRPRAARPRRRERARARASCTARCGGCSTLDDYVEVWPGHIGGSLCGGAGMSETPGSTIGFERRFNRLLRLRRATTPSSTS